MRTLFLSALLITACRAPEAEPTQPSGPALELRRSFHPNGGVESEVPVVDGLQHGALIAYFPDGTVKARQGWSRGRPVGEHKVYTADGVLRYHAVSTLEQQGEAQFMAYSVLLNDSTVQVSTANRLVITDTAALLASVKVEPDTALLLGIDRAVRIRIPNVPSFIPSVRNGTIRKDGAGDRWTLRATVPGGPLELRLSAQVNDTVFEFDPVVLPVR